MKLPEVRINFAWLLFNDESQWLAGDRKLENFSKYEEWTVDYRKEWRKHEQKILTALQTALGVEFYKSVIDVSCAPYFVTKSDPLVVNFLNEPDQFVDVLTHELCHVLLTDNNKLQLRGDKPSIDLAKTWYTLFGKNHDFKALVHIPVHALSKYIYLEILKEPSRLDRDIESILDFNTAYLEAWRYVNKNNYKKIISDLKKSYEEIRV